MKNKAKTQGNLDGADMTAEERLEEKRKAEEAQRQADLESAKELFGGRTIVILDIPYRIWTLFWTSHIESGHYSGRPI